jgi:hypothetical protein
VTNRLHAILSLLYLAVPVGIFFASWLWWPYAVTIVTALVLALGRAVKRIRQDGDDRRAVSMSRGNAVGVAIVTLLLAFYSGAGGLAFQRGDWPKHNAMLTELTERSWPVRLRGEPGILEGSYLTYYVAYYVPAALAGRVLDIEVAHLALFLWTLAGLGLAALWVLRLIPSAGWMVWAAWFALSGLDVLAALVVWMIGTGWELSHGVDWWPGFGTYSCNMGLLLWVPQHMLAGWIATALIVSRAEERRDVSLAPLIASVTVMWSPFVTLGLAPIILAAITKTGWRDILRADLVTPLAIALVSAAALAGVGQQAIPRGWVAAQIGFIPWLLTWLAIIVVEFGFCAAPAYWVLRRARRSGETAASGWSRRWLVTAVAVLLVLPFYRLGLFNDLMSRASIPAFFVLWVVVLRVVRAELSSGPRPAISLVLACLAVASILPLNQMREQLVRTTTVLTFMDAVPSRRIGSLEPPIRDQYVGATDSFYARHLAP